ncbi:MAG: 2-keto-3-deoxy-L-fuconate dehydrogenase [Microbacteriaceae bacterium]|jgi:NAD(P)-dependent dehydrogenase (short-subunit alcohol dehydrogenase family)|nr:2-keto-3-deoxy-L-fuconate dehydrogenase [Microbacteriaceae bacterium]
MSEEFTGLTAVVTGAGSGIGLATARTFTAAGARVFGLDINVGAMDGVAEWIPCDVGSTDSVTTAFITLAARVDALDILVNNAGIGAVGSVEVATDEEWARVLNINVAGIARVTKAALPMLRRSAAASIVNTCSIAATAGLPQRAIYSASKGAVQSLTLAMAADLIHEHIRVNGVNPGTADTPWVARLLNLAADPLAERAALEHRQPSGRLVTAEEVASAIKFLASPEQLSTTGAMLAVDGGMYGLRVAAR